MGLKLVNNGYELAYEALKKAAENMEETVNFGHGFFEEYNVDNYATAPLIWVFPFKPLFTVNNGIEAAFDISILFAVAEKLQVTPEKALKNYIYAWEMSIRYFSELMLLKSVPYPNNIKVRIDSIGRGEEFQGATDKHLTGHKYTIRVTCSLNCCE